jgi:TonB-dependent starch-binding outer membrane protein SusC
MRFATFLSLTGSLFLPSAVVAQAQVGRITGTVTSADSAILQPLGGATILVLGTGIGTTTGSDGRYSIANVPVGTHTVRAQRIGFAAQERSVVVTEGQTVTIDFGLSTQAIRLSEVVSVGYGTQLRRDITGSVASVTTEALERGTPIVSLDQLLQGTAPGVHVNTASSAPGGGISVRIRGTASLGASSEPLYVIDGFPLESDETSLPGNAGRDRTAPPNPLAALNPNDIERIDILKDASATAIYGSRGANGVVLITTKQGQVPRPQVTLDFYAGVQEVTKRYDLLNAQEYMDYANEWAANASPPIAMPYPQSVRDTITSNTDWQDLVFREATVRNLQLTTRGATRGENTTRYSLSGGYYDQTGIVMGSGLRRYSGRVNVAQQVGTRLQLGGNLTANRARSQSVPTDGQQNRNAGAVSAALQYPAILPVRRPNGTYSYIDRDIPLAFDPPETPNPVSLAADVRDSLSDTRVLGNVFGEYRILDGLELRLSFGADYADRWRYTYYPSTTLRGFEAGGGEAIRSSVSTTSWVNDNTLTYQRQFGQMHDLTLLGGYSRERRDLDGETINGTGFVNDVTGYADIDAATEFGSPTSRQTAWALESWLGRVNYSLLDRYLLTLTGRRDGSSRFGAAHKWAFFPSAAFAWRASSEPFLETVTYLDELKLRVAYGEVGNPAIAPYQSLARLTAQGYSFGGTTAGGYFVASIANPDLRWERSKEVNVGLDVGVLNRVTLVADYYRKKTTDLLLQVNLPFESGFESALQNLGALENRGFELGIDARIIDAADRGGVSWRASLSYARNRNKVTDLGGQPRIFAQTPTGDYNIPGSVVEVGQPIGMFFGFKSGGIVRDSAHAASIPWRDFDGSPFQPGDVLILDVSGPNNRPDSVITVADQTIIGDPTPDFTYGITNTIGYRGFELSALIQGVQGNEILNINRIRTEGSSPRANISRERWVNRWTPQNPNAKFPRVRENPNQVSPNNYTDNLLEDGSYLRLRSATLSYLIPSSWTGRYGVNAARVYVTGTNLFTATDYSGFNPDVSSQGTGNANRGIDIGAYPLARTITFGVNLTH